MAIKFAKDYELGWVRRSAGSKKLTTYVPLAERERLAKRQAARDEFTSTAPSMLLWFFGIMLIIAIYKFLSNIQDPNYILEFSFDSFISAFSSENIKTIDLNWIQNLNLDYSGITIPFFKSLFEKFNDLFVGIVTFGMGITNSLLFIAQLLGNLLF